MWARPPGFATLVHIILEQQVSLASARAAFDRLGEALATIAPAPFLSLSEQALRSVGFSRQKAGYCRLLAESILAGRLDLAELPACDDERVQARLTAEKGIGPWTAQIYLLMVLLRPDVWPRGDIALATAYGELTDSPRPRDADLAVIAQRWQPWRAVAARMLWHAYLSTPRQRR
jgi:DNA-3-methyladenine glycosylase II